MKQVSALFLCLLMMTMCLSDCFSNETIGKDSAEISEKVKMYSDEVENSDYYIKSFNSNVSDISIGFTLNQSVDDDIFSFNLTMDPLEQYGGVPLPGYSGSYDSNAVLNLVSNFTGEDSQINNYSMSIELDQKYRNITSSIWYVSSNAWVQLDAELSQITDGQILIEFESGPIFPTGQIVLMGFELTTMETPTAYPESPSLIWNNQTSGNISLSVNWLYTGSYTQADHINIELQKYLKNAMGDGYSNTHSSMMVLDSGDLSVTTFEISSFDTDDAQYIVIISVCNGAGCNPITASLTFFLGNQTSNITQDSDNDNVTDDIDLCPSTYSWWTVDDDGCADEQLDDDDDGVSNAVDDCPNTPEVFNALNSRGCSFEDLQDLDSDDDGVLDSNDACPNTPADVAVDSIGCDLDGNQTADTDSDDDGVLDSNDACPNTPADVAVDSIGCDLDGNQTADTDSDGDGVYDSLDECANTTAGATADFKGCPMDSDYDGVYDGIDECPSSNNPSPSDMDKSTEVDSTGCFIDAAGSKEDSVPAVFLGIIVMIGLLVFVVTKVRSPKPEQVFYQQTQPASSPMSQISSREMELENQSRKAQMETQRVRQELANLSQHTQQLQREASQKKISDQALAQKQHQLVIAQQEKEELEAKLAEAEKTTTVVQNITYNIQDSAISGDITANLNSNDNT